MTDQPNTETDVEFVERFGNMPLYEGDSGLELSEDDHVRASELLRRALIAEGEVASLLAPAELAPSGEAAEVMRFPAVAPAPAGDVEQRVLAFIGDLIRFADWGAGEGYAPLESENVPAPDEMLFEFAEAVGLADPDGADDYIRFVRSTLAAMPSGRQRGLLEAAEIVTELAKEAKHQADHGGVPADYWQMRSNWLNEAASAIRTAAAQLGAPDDGWRSAAARDVLAERRRQVESEGWTPEHDDKHNMGEMANAAAVYAMRPTFRHLEFFNGDTVGQRLWPWQLEWWKPTKRRRDLVKAGALILAEIERLDRLPPAPSVPR